ncbi:MAG: aminoglycoside phosphotransferase family protein [Planctomycetota bacterium]|jgi:hypothetical protein|nr:aminoglycoside phosphotransferase family protein [Planctomycetota bacterium]
MRANGDDALAGLLRKAGVGGTPEMPLALAGGRNNRVYRLETTDGPVFLKQYHRGGDWDRLAAESRFLRFCEKRGVNRVPLLLAEDRENALALHSWIVGGRPDPETAGGAGMRGAADFLRDLAGASSGKDGNAPPARDACLCLEDFFRSPRERLRDLAVALERRTDEGPLPGRVVDAAACFLRKVLFPYWEEVRDVARARLGTADLSAPFPGRELIFSPSDFGFHNVLMNGDGEPVFTDFEYAGLDDPAKAIGDFLCQADYVPGPAALGELAGAVRRSAGEAAKLAERVATLLPLFHVKFCCIILNDFKTADAERRAFANLPAGVERVSAQLRKAERYFRERRP